MEKDNFLKHQMKSFSQAFHGIWYNFKTQLHFRMHVLAAFLVVGLGFYYSIDSFEWILIVFAVSMVLAAETINTAVEETVNLLQPEIHPHARFAKHCAAASVLIVSISAAIIGLIIFLPKIFNF